MMLYRCIISVLFAKLDSSQGKRLRTNSLNEEQTLFLTLLKTFYFFTPVGKQTIFFLNPSPL